MPSQTIGLITLFPDLFNALQYGVVGRALAKQCVCLETWDPRSFSGNPHGYIDDKPFGGSAGMVMRYQPLRDTIMAAKESLGPSTPVIYLSPQGQLLQQKTIQALAQYPQLILLCGRYEGVDERLIQHHVDQEYSIGDYIISGGELAALVLMDAMIRLQPGVLHNPQSLEQDSLAKNSLLGPPRYTRPQTIDGHQVPEVLLSGNHQAIQAWEHQAAVARTKLRRPDLWHTHVQAEHQDPSSDEP